MPDRKRVLAAAAALAFVGAGPLAATASFAASLQTADLDSPGDNLLTVDPNTGLEFLDPAVTSGLTYNQLAASDFVQQRGFTAATTSQLRQFLSDGGITNFSGDFNTTDEAAVENLLGDFIGQTITGPITLPPAGQRSISDGVYGFTLDPDTPEGQFNVAGLDYQSAELGQAPQDQARTIVNLITFGGDQLPPNPSGNGINGSIVGGFLVRPTNAQAVPEPASFGMLAMGLLVLAGGAAIRRRRAPRLAGVWVRIRSAFDRLPGTRPELG